MGDLRNKMRKRQQQDAERLMRLRIEKARERSPPTLKCDGCGMVADKHWTKEGKFIRLFAIANEKGWGQGKVYCEFCLEQHTGMNPNGLP